MVSIGLTLLWSYGKLCKHSDARATESNLEQDFHCDAEASIVDMRKNDP